jgi:hypothetical protein
VLGKHQIALLSRRWTKTIAEAIGELHRRVFIAPAVVLRKGRIAQDAIVVFDLAAIFNGHHQHIVIFDHGVRNPVQQQVHLANRPNPAVVVLSIQPQVSRIAAMLLNVLLGQN